jgi:hypothetical protein
MISDIFALPVERDAKLIPSRPVEMPAIHTTSDIDENNQPVEIISFSLFCEVFKTSG